MLSYPRSLAFIIAALPISYLWVRGRSSAGLAFQAEPCPQVEPLFPILHAALLARLDETYKNARFKSIVYEKLGGAIRIPCDSLSALLLRLHRCNYHYLVLNRTMA